MTPDRTRAPATTTTPRCHSWIRRPKTYARNRADGVRFSAFLDQPLTQTSPTRCRSHSRQAICPTLEPSHGTPRASSVTSRTGWTGKPPPSGTRYPCRTWPVERSPGWVRCRIPRHRRNVGRRPGPITMITATGMGTSYPTCLARVRVRAVEIDEFALGPSWMPSLHSADALIVGVSLALLCPITILQGGLAAVAAGRLVFGARHCQSLLARRRRWNRRRRDRCACGSSNRARHKTSERSSLVWRLAPVRRRGRRAVAPRLHGPSAACSNENDQFRSFRIRSCDPP